MGQLVSSRSRRFATWKILIIESSDGSSATIVSSLFSPVWNSFPTEKKIGAPAPLELDFTMSCYAVAWCTLFLFLTGEICIDMVQSRQIQNLPPESYIQPNMARTFTNPFSNLIRAKRSNTQLKLCGNQLINMLSIMCRVYQSSRDSSKYEDGVEDLGHNSLNRHSKHIFRKKRSLENFPNTIRHGLSSLVSSLPQGLSTRCCVSSCSMQQLMLAC